MTESLSCSFLAVSLRKSPLLGKLMFSSCSLPDSTKERWLRKGFPQSAKLGLSQAGRHSFREMDMAWIATGCAIREDKEKLNYLSTRGNMKMVCRALIFVVLAIHTSHSTLQRGGEIMACELSPFGSLIKVTAYLCCHPHETAAVLQYR